MLWHHANGCTDIGHLWHIKILHQKREAIIHFSPLLHRYLYSSSRKKLEAAASSMGLDTDQDVYLDLDDFEDGVGGAISEYNPSIVS